MKVTRNTPDHLILNDTPWLIGIMLAGFVFVFLAIGLLVSTDNMLAGLAFGGLGALIGGACFAVFVRRTQIILNASDNTLKLQRQSVFGYQSVTHPLDDLSHAIVETAMPSRTGSTNPKSTSRITLVFPAGMSAGHHPVTQVYTSGGGATRGADAINTWLNAHRA